MKALVVTDKAAGMAGAKLLERPDPQPAINDVVVQMHASGFTGDELTWPSTWTDRVGRDRTPSIPGHELAGVVTALGYGTTGLSIGQRVFGLTDWYRDGTLAEYVAVEARNLTPLPGDVDFTLAAALVMPGLTAWQGLFEHGRLRAGQSVLVHGAAGVVGSMASQLARLSTSAHRSSSTSITKPWKTPINNSISSEQAMVQAKSAKLWRSSRESPRRGFCKQWREWIWAELRSTIRYSISKRSFSSRTSVNIPPLPSRGPNSAFSRSQTVSRWPLKKRAFRLRMSSL